MTESEKNWAAHAVEFIRNFGVKEAVRIGGVVAAVITGHGVGTAVGNLVVALGEVIRTGVSSGA